MELKSTALPARPSPFTPIAIALAGWFFVMLAVCRLELLKGAPSPAVGGMILTLVLLQIAAFRKWELFRRWARSTDLRLPVLLHLVRFAGIAYLVLAVEGRLPEGFAAPAGWGDIAIAGLAPAAALMASSRSRAGRWGAGIWNMAGLVHIIMVGIMGTGFGLHDPRMGEVLTVVPLSLLPAFVIPLLIGSHLLLALRLYRR